MRLAFLASITLALPLPLLLPPLIEQNAATRKTLLSVVAALEKQAMLSPLLLLKLPASYQQQQPSCSPLTCSRTLSKEHNNNNKYRFINLL